MTDETNSNLLNNHAPDFAHIDHEIHVSDKSQLHRVYMPFIKGGGLFIAMNSDYLLNETIRIKFYLIDEPIPYFVEGKVVWINPAAAQGGLPKGVGIQFINKETQVLRDKIENHLTGFISAGCKTDTM